MTIYNEIIIDLKYAKMQLDTGNYFHRNNQLTLATKCYIEALKKHEHHSSFFSAISLVRQDALIYYKSACMNFESYHLGSAKEKLSKALEVLSTLKHEELYQDLLVPIHSLFAQIYKAQNISYPDLAAYYLQEMQNEKILTEIEILVRILYELGNNFLDLGRKNTDKNCYMDAILNYTRGLSIVEQRLTVEQMLDDEEMLSEDLSLLNKHSSQKLFELLKTNLDLARKELMEILSEKEPAKTNENNPYGWWSLKQQPSPPRSNDAPLLKTIPSEENGNVIIEIKDNFTKQYLLHNLWSLNIEYRWVQHNSGVQISEQDYQKLKSLMPTENREIISVLKQPIPWKTLSQ